MSNIPKSQRKPTKIDFFIKAINLRQKTIEYIDQDFGVSKRLNADGTPYQQYWIIVKLRDSIYDAIQDYVLCLTQANTIYITNMYEYNARRKYMTQAIGDLEFVIQELQYAIRSFGVKPSKYTLLIEDMEECIKSVKAWRKSDNAVKNKLQGNV